MSLNLTGNQYQNYDRYNNCRQFLSDKDKIQHVLGDAIYLIHTKGQDGRREEINWELRDKLKKEFHMVISKIV